MNTKKKQKENKEIMNIQKKMTGMSRKTPGKNIRHSKGDVVR